MYYLNLRWRAAEMVAMAPIEMMAIGVSRNVYGEDGIEIKVSAAMPSARALPRHHNIMALAAPAYRAA